MVVRDVLDVIHLDMDCFFAAVEVQADPSLVGRPVIVAGLGPRGVVASASYEARVFGVRSAMPTSVARRQCPDGVFLSGRHDLYSAKSVELLEILRHTSPIVEPIALDEAFLDISGAHRLLGPSREIAARVKENVETALGLKCAVGVGRSKLVAKLASRRAKPLVGADGIRPGLGICVVEIEEEAAFLHSHVISDLPGVGPKTGEALRRLSVRTVADLELFGRDALVKLLGRAHGNSLFDLATGLDDRSVEPDRAMKSIGSEETFDVDVNDQGLLESKTRELAAIVGSRCRAGEFVAKTVMIKVRFGDFTSTTRSHTLGEATSTSSVIAEIGVDLLREVETAGGVRLIGISLSGLVAESTANAMQLDLFTSAEELIASGRTKHGGVENAADEIRRRFGPTSIRSLAAASRPLPRNGPTNRPISPPPAP